MHYLERSLDHSKWETECRDRLIFERMGFFNLGLLHEYPWFAIIDNLLCAFWTLGINYLLASVWICLVEISVIFLLTNIFELTKFLLVVFLFISVLFQHPLQSWNSKKKIKNCHLLPFMGTQSSPPWTPIEYFEMKKNIFTS